MSTEPLNGDAASGFRRMWHDLETLGLDGDSGGYSRFAWTREDSDLREWFAGECTERGLDLTTDRMGNQWAWWGDPDAAVAAGDPGVVIGSHLDSVPDGGAFDGPLGVVGALAAVDQLRRSGFEPSRPVGVVNFADEEGARFGVACAGSRVITGALGADRARGLTDIDGVTMAEAMRRAGRDPGIIGRDDEALARIGTFVELHVEQGRHLVDLGHAVGVGSDIWPHGRWRVDVPGEANHAGTTRLDDREDAMLGLAAMIIAARRAAEQHGCVATVGKVEVVPGGVNAIASRATGWLDARGTDAESVLRVVDEVRDVVADFEALVTQESWTPTTDFDPALVRRMSTLLGGLPVIGTGAGHDAGILANDGIRTAMLFVRNPTGVSHSPDEWASADDCLDGIAALADVVTDLAGGWWMTTFWCEHALLPGGVRRSVRVVTARGRIVEVRTDARAEPGDTRLGGVVLPGLANGHSHAFHRALRGRTHDDGGNFWTWRDAMYAVTHRLDPETYHALAKAVFAEMLLAGYTAVGEFHYVHHAAGGRRYGDPNLMGKALISAAREVGIRITLLDTCYLAGGLFASGHLPLDDVQQRFSDGTVQAWAERVALLSDDQTVRIGAAVHSVRAVPRNDLAVVGEFASRDARPLHVHLSEQPGENLACQGFYGCSPTELLAAEGLLTPATTAVHATHLSDNDIELLGDARATACFCPTTERDLADGIGPARRLHDAGTSLSLGSDQHAVIDPFEELRGVEMHERLESLERGRFAGADLLAMATLNGYRSLGWDDGGVLAGGHVADLVAVRLDSPRTAGCAPDGVLYAATSADVTDVVVAGDRVVQNGQHRAGDVGRMLTEAIAAVRR